MTPISVADRSAAGFTLLELMVVLAILAMGSMLVIPNITGMSSRTFNAQVRETTVLLNYARRTAVITGQQATATFRAQQADDAFDNAESGANSGRNSGSNSGSNSSSNSEYVNTRSRLGREESWTSRGLELAYRDSTDQLSDVEDSVDITFFPEGGSTGGALILSQGDRRAIVSVDPFSGKIKTEFPDD